MNKCLLPEFAAVWIHYEAQTTTLLGDLKQLSPVVTVKPRGSIPEMSRSTLHFFAANHYPIAEIFTQRRSAHGIMDIGYKRYYRGLLSQGLVVSSIPLPSW